MDGKILVATIIFAFLCVQDIHCHHEVGWCVISDDENAKCLKMVEALKGEGVMDMQCVRGANAQECVELIARGEAHLVTLDGGDVFYAGSQFGMKPIMGEEYDYGKEYYAVAVVRRQDSDLTFRKLRGRKSCHTGIRKTAGWNVPVGYLISQGIIELSSCQSDVKAAAAFFSQSCAPGALNRDFNPERTTQQANLCALCKGDGTNKCARNGHEPYYNYDGAFRCLVEEAGDVAFVKHTTVQDVLDSAPGWATGRSRSNFRLMCPDGTTKPVDQFLKCHLAKVVGHAVVTSASASAADIAEYQQILTTAQEKFGSDDGEGFKLFDSSGYSSKDLLFKDATQRLYPITVQSYVDHLGEDYVRAVQGLSECPANTLRWCVVGDAEHNKCLDWKAALAGHAADDHSHTHTGADDHPHTHPDGTEPHTHSPDEPHPHTHDHDETHTHEETHTHTGTDDHDHSHTETHSHTGADTHPHTHEETHTHTGTADHPHTHPEGTEPHTHTDDEPHTHTHVDTEPHTHSPDEPHEHTHSDDHPHTHDDDDSHSHTHTDTHTHSRPKGHIRSLSCFRAKTHAECMSRIKSQFADLVTLDGGDILTAGREFGMKPIAGEAFGHDLSTAAYYAVAVAKRNSDVSIKNLKGKKSCHTGMGKTAGWVMPISYLVDSKQIDGKTCDFAKELGNFFSQSCVPGAKNRKYNPSMSTSASLCDLCIGGGQNNCARNSNEPYYDYSGAFRCLADGAGDVAFVKHTTVASNTDGSNQDTWARNLNSRNYQLLCSDGSRERPSNGKSCNLGRVPTHAVMARGSADVDAMWSFIDEAQHHFGTLGTETDRFKLFDSSKYGGSNLIFSDTTSQLVAAGKKNTAEKWLGDDYVKALNTVLCLPNIGVRLTLSTALLFAVFLVTRFLRI